MFYEWYLKERRSIDVAGNLPSHAIRKELKEGKISINLIFPSKIVRENVAIKQCSPPVPPKHPNNSHRLLTTASHISIHSKWAGKVLNNSATMIELRDF